MSTSQEAAADIPDALVVRVGAHGLDWTDHLPPVPAECTVSVSFDTLQLQRSAVVALSELGYLPAGLASAGAFDHPGALFVVPRASVARRGTWWRALAAVADRVYDPAFGPVRALLRQALQAHTRAVGAGRA